jgi:guanylate kinase
VERVLSAGKHVVMDIDVQGAQQFTRVFPDSVTIFVLPPSAETLLERLRQRQTESREQLARRLQSALQELQSVDLYQYVVVNDELPKVVGRVSAIIDAEVVRRQRVRGLKHQVSALVQRLERELQD